MRRVIKFLPLVLSALLGIDWALTGFRYIQFYSGGSGFMIPVPTVVVILFFSGLAMITASILSIWFRRFGAALCIAVLVLTAILTIVQTFLHQNPSEVILRRGGFVALYILLATTLYWAWLKKRKVSDV